MLEFRISAILALMTVISMAAAARSGDGGATAAEFLRLGAGARAPAMGDAWTAGAEGVGALHYNPALLGSIERAEVEGMYQRSVLDIGRGTFGAAWPLGANGGWGFSINYLDYGSTNRTLISAPGGVTAGVNAGVFSGRDFAAGLSGGRRWGSLSAGLTGRIISARYDNASAVAGAIDLGLAWRAPALPVTIGVSLRNLGTRLQFDRTREDLPLALRAGLAWNPLADGRLRLHVELEETRDEEARLLAGGEYWVMSQFALRAGYDGRNAVGSGLTLGLGFRRDAFSVDYAFIPFGKAGDEHRIGLGYRFAP